MGAMVAQWHCATQPLQREGVIPEEFASACVAITPGRMDLRDRLASGVAMIRKWLKYGYRPIAVLRTTGSIHKKSIQFSLSRGLP